MACWVDCSAGFELWQLAGRGRCLNTIRLFSRVGWLSLLKGSLENYLQGLTKLTLHSVCMLTAHAVNDPSVRPGSWSQLHTFAC